MATREGIYVGGKDIIERYVGDKLVWSKWIRIGSVRSINSPKSFTSTVASMDINNSSRFINHPRYGRGRTKKVKIVDNNNNSNVLYLRSHRFALYVLKSVNKISIAEYNVTDIPAFKILT